MDSNSRLNRHLKIAELYAKLVGIDSPTVRVYYGPPKTHEFLEVQESFSETHGQMYDIYIGRLCESHVGKIGFLQLGQPILDYDKAEAWYAQNDRSRRHPA